ncbi:MAG: DUF1294 domain-containing protein [Candidatus Peribacteria bacterium]|jgi:uncharacterized membrane protein YsdA (DUF1294 family)|nr:DUF1294 domain-containing protein [Candidatus Peribacteria bacterium]
MFFLCYFITINLITFILRGVDKRKAILKKWRISEKVLLLFCAFGGRMGALLAMGFRHHKTVKSNFLSWFYLILGIRIAAATTLYLLLS